MQSLSHILVRTNGTKTNEGVVIQRLLSITVQRNEYADLCIWGFLAGCYGKMSTSNPLYPEAAYQPQLVIHHRRVPPSFCPAECHLTCSSACTPSCCATASPVPTVIYSSQSPTVSSPQLPQCAVPCGGICAPSCTPACCYTVYRSQMVNYWKRHHLHAHRHTWKVKGYHKNMTGM